MMVMIMGFGNRVAFLTSLKLIPITVGYIIKKRSMPIGIDIWANLRESRYWPTCGRNLPSSSPAIMHIVIQRVRYFSKNPSDASESGAVYSIYCVPEYAEGKDICTDLNLLFYIGRQGGTTLTVASLALKV